MQKTWMLYVIFVLVWLSSGVRGDEVLDIGSRLELFVDYHLVSEMQNARLKLHKPCPAPLELGRKGGYATVIKDGDIYRLYYRTYIKDFDEGFQDGHPAEITCYMESTDGVHWEAPELGLYDIKGAPGNVIMHEPPLCHNFSPFLDTKPGVEPDKRYKALSGLRKVGLVAFVSGDGIHWRKLRKASVFNEQVQRGENVFDSQNVSFWSKSEGCYVLYYRRFVNKLRQIARTTSEDFINWSEPVMMQANIEGEHLYTNQTSPYFRAPHIYIATPTRFRGDPEGWTDVVLMSTRGGNKYNRAFMKAFIRPGLNAAMWRNRANYAALNVVPTGKGEMSLYLMSNRVGARRLVLRTDGFASVNAGFDGGEMITRPLRFEGGQLVINCSTAGSGRIRVEIQDSSGEPFAGYSLADCPAIMGDEIEHVVSWKNGSNVSKLAGKVVQLRFKLKDADLYSLRFRR